MSATSYCSFVSMLASLCFMRATQSSKVSYDKVQSNNTKSYMPLEMLQKETISLEQQKRSAKVPWIHPLFCKFVVSFCVTMKLLWE